MDATHRDRDEIPAHLRTIGQRPHTTEPLDEGLLHDVVEVPVAPEDSIDHTRDVGGVAAEQRARSPLIATEKPLDQRLVADARHGRGIRRGGHADRS